MNFYSENILVTNIQIDKQDINSNQKPFLVSPSSCYFPHPRVTIILALNIADYFCLVLNII